MRLGMANSGGAERARAYAQRRARSYCGRRRHRPRVFLSMTPCRLHRSRDIRTVFAARNAAQGRLMTVHAVRRAVRGCGGPPPRAVREYGARGGTVETPSNTEDDRARATVIAGKDVGGSVQRNRAKRRLRAALAAGSLPPGLDFVVRARTAAVDADFQALQAELSDLIGRAAAKADMAVVRAGGRQA